MSMSAYLQRTRALAAAALLAFAVCFGLAFATQAYAESGGGGDTQQLAPAQGLQAQAGSLSGDEEIITIGEGTATSNKTAPFYCYNNNSATETIYTSDEIGIAGTINSIAWQAANDKTLTVNNLKVYLGHTSESSFSGSAITPDDLTLVYTSSEDFAGDAGYRQIVLDTPFEYNGTDNLLVVAVWAGKWNNAPSFNVESKSGMVWVKTSDSNTDSFADWETIRDAASPAASYPSERPNIRLAIEEDVSEGAPAIKTTSLPSVNLGEAYSASIKVKANPAATVTVSGLPEGLSFDPETMTISGTPTQAGTFPVVITATNGIEPDATAAIDLAVTTEAPAITTESLPNGKVGKAYSATIEATGVPVPTISVAGLPAGLTFDTATNTIAGIPTEAGKASVTVTAHNGYGDDAVETYSFTIKSASASEEIEVVVGTGTSSPNGGNGVPFHNYFRNAVSQSVYLSSEIVNEGEAIEEGAINAISYYVGTPLSGGINNTLLDIYLGYTSAAEAGSTGLTVTDRTLVYSNSSGINTGSVEGWEAFELDEPFEYDSSKGNLIVTIVRTASNDSSNPAYQASEGKTGLFKNDTTSYTDVDEGISHIDTVKNYRANIKLSMEVGGAAPKFSAQPEGFTYKAGDPQGTALSATATSKVGVPSFVWYKSDNGTLADAAAVAASATPVTESAEGTAADGAYVSTYTPAASDLTATGTVYYYCVAADSVGSTASKPAAVQIYDQDAQAPVGTFVIASEPAAEDGVVTAGETTTVSFTASGVEPAVAGDPLYYQWYKKGAGDTDFVEIDGATADAYDAMVVVGETAYQCRVHASHQIESNVSEDVVSNVITINGTALTITSAEGLADFRDAVNAGDNFVGRTVLIGEDIDVSNVEGGWTPIGASQSAKRFAGTFDGQGHTIKIGSFAEGVTSPALFGYVRGEAAIKNLTVSGTIESAQYSVSAVANTSYGATFENVRNLASVSTSDSSGRAAGIVAGVGAGGSDDPTVFLNCTNKGSISTGGSSGYASGIANLGATSSGCIATFENCYNTGTISGVATMYGDCYICGIVSVNKNNNNANTLTNCYNAGALSGGEYERGYGLASKATLVGANYYLAGAPDGGVGTPSGEGTAVSKTADEMAAAEFVTLLGESYVAGSALSPAQATPALAWENSVANTPPTLAQGVEPEVEAKQFAGLEWTCDLSAIFVDAESDVLAYTVAINGEDSVATEADFSYTVPEEGATTLVFTASDGQEDSPTYTVTLTQREVVTASIDFTSQMSGGFLHAPQFGVEVSNDKAERYGYTDAVEGVSALDVLVAAHEQTFGADDFAEDPASYLVINESNFVTTVFGESTSNFSFVLNGECPADKTTTFDSYSYDGQDYLGLDIASAPITTDDFVEFFVYQSSYVMDYYAWFADSEGRVDAVDAVAGEPLSLAVRGYQYAWYGLTVDPSYHDGSAIVEDEACEDLPIVMVDENGGFEPLDPAIAVGEDGEFAVTFAKPGVYMLAIQGDEYTDVVTSLVRVTVKGPITATVSISKYGQFVNGKDGEPVVQVPVTLTGKASYTIDDALRAVHEACYEGGADAGYATYTSQWGPGVAMLWGDTSYNFGYQLNYGDAYVMGPSDAISDGDALDAYILTSSYENYSTFDEATATVAAGEPLELTLNEWTYGPAPDYAFGKAPLEGASVHVNGQPAEGAPVTVTDADGKATLSFDEPGTYIVTATKTKVVGEETVTAITAPACVVTVTDTITATVSISKYGQFVNGKDGEPVVQVPVTLTGKASYTIDDALRAVHEACYEGGADAGYATYTSQWGPGVAMLWGDTSYNFGYQLNYGDAYVMGPSDAISDGDALDAYILTSSYENYSTFDEATATVAAGEPLELTLNEWTYGPAPDYAFGKAPLEGASVHVNGQPAEGAPVTVTDADGKATLSFDEPGTYIVTATKTKVVGEETVTAITAPACVVTVVTMKEALQSLVDEAEKADVSDAGDETKAALNEAIQSAVSLLNQDPSATDEQLAQAKKALSDALEQALDEHAANGGQAASDLEKAIADAEAANVSNASDATKAGLAAALEAAKGVAANPNATTAEKIAATKALTDALKKANEEQAAAGKMNNGLPVGATFTVKDANGTWTYKVTAAKQVMLTKAAKTKKKGKATINTVAYQGVTYGVTAIGAKALSGSKLKAITVGDNVTSIGAQAFAKSKLLKKFTVGKNVAKIGAKAFAKAKKLKKITVKSAKLTTPASVKGALKGSKVKKVKLSGVKGAAKKQTKKAFKKAGKKGVKVK